MPNGSVLSDSPATGTVWAAALIPVQSWIAEATRSRDLQLSSALLSHLMARILGGLRAEFPTLEFRQPHSDFLAGRIEPLSQTVKTLLRAPDAGSRYGLPNRASGIVPDVSPDELANWFESQSILQDSWAEFVGQACKQLPSAVATLSLIHI